MRARRPKRLSVVIVDDVSGLRRLLRIALEETGEFEVVGEAADGVEAIVVAEHLKPDLMLLDLSMPRMDGLEALPRVVTASPDTKVVVLSGLTEERMGRRARELGASAYLEKGVEPQELARVLHGLGHPGTSGPTPSEHGGTSMSLASVARG